jgi:NAD(P)-dependent dehydrogenase (short-subunit alcohol dehydrogenase family)
MIVSLLAFWSIFGCFLFGLYSIVEIHSIIRYIYTDFLILASFVYLSWNFSNWVWKKVPFPKEKVSTEDRAVFITGCDTGFGHELAKKLSSFGFTVYAGCLIPNGSGAQALKEFSDKIKVVRLDVTSDADVFEARKFVEADLKRSKEDLWAIVNNAGILASTEIEMGSIDPFKSQIEVNTIGVIRVTKSFLPLLRRTKGRVVNVASLAGRFSIPGMVGYCVSKCGVISFSDGLRREMKKWDIDVITIEPHLFNTNLVNNEANHRILNKAWEETPSDIKADYGHDYFIGYQLFLNKVLGSARPRISRVVDTMFTAVTDQFVGTCYPVLGDIESLRIWMWGFWPDRALDLLSYHASVWTTGQPAAKIKAIYDKKKKV